MDSHDRDQQALQREIADLERRLRHAKSQLTSPPSPSPSSDSSTLSDAPRALTPPPPSSPPSDAALHTLLLLADSALPLGSFAFSSGLESYLAHHRPATSSASQVPAFHHFLRVSLHTLASTALPYVLAGYRAPHLIADLDNDFDASTPCTVARRASVAQGRALLAIWDRSFKASYHQAASPSSVADVDDAIAALARFQAALRASTSATPLPPNAHLAPLWGLLTRILGVELHEAAYLFLFSHARTVTSAAVRASVLGPYQAQAVLADARLRERVSALVREHWDTPIEEAGQVVPVVDLWVGRHEKLYSRIFNS
ncbi:putative urease accessory protein [Neofusicoccum parvum UCRNP2]|uniref:Urease accessory protein n=2 Tax=Neofusicoccum parvum TaxID=310453 RepID=A0ACB5S856_9PEZI|nr:putative urease accessory protein [Neofusicoccum parvum UCRNP2]GME28995.1 Urease accessory protein [Neofusicoccum parvum]